MFLLLNTVSRIAGGSLLSEPPGKLIRYLDLLIHSLAYNTIIA